MRDETEEALEDQAEDQDSSSAVTAEAPVDEASEGEAGAIRIPPLRIEMPEETPEAPSRTAVGVSFRRSGKVYYFSIANVACEVGDRVIAATEKGVDIGEVVEFRPTLVKDESAPPSEATPTQGHGRRHRA